MNTVIDKQRCTGCTACKNICPQKCITMKENEEGFLYPVIDEKKCIHCGLCKKICPVLNSKNESNELPKTFVGFNKNEQERVTSSSGGLFQLLANKILEENGVVCGAFFEEGHLVHGFAKSKEELEKMKGSKYVQSNLEECFPKIKEFLNEEKKVLFVGTACQVAGLQAYLQKEYSNLLTCDVVCHGVPSPKVFLKYCEMLEKKYESKIIRFDFRNKDKGWQNYSVKINFENGKIYQKRFSEDIYMRGFLQNVYLRESCYHCSFKQKKHCSDITLGDYWGIKKYYKNMNDQKGTSVIFCNTSKALDAINEIKENLLIEECSFLEGTYDNTILFTSVNENKNRLSFFKDLNSLGLEDALQKNVLKDPLWKKIIKKLLRF